jgi:ribosomal protein S18 acetylase RimI-like enzyme
MSDLGRLSGLRAVEPTDEGFLYDVFATTWESEVAALPNQNLARHVLRIQHIAQERRFASRYPGHQRLLILSDDGERAGRLYLLRTGSALHVVDLTVMPEFRGRGLGSRVLQQLMELAEREDLPIAARVSRANTRVTDACARVGFELVDIDDLDNFLRWRPTPQSADAAEVRVGAQGGSALSASGRASDPSFSRRLPD